MRILSLAVALVYLGSQSWAAEKPYYYRCNLQGPISKPIELETDFNLRAPDTRSPRSDMEVNKRSYVLKLEIDGSKASGKFMDYPGTGAKWYPFSFDLPKSQKSKPKGFESRVGSKLRPFKLSCR